MRAYITGPTGAIGTALIDELVENNIEVVAILNPGSKRKDNIKKDELVKIVECDLAQLKELPAVLKDRALINSRVVDDSKTTTESSDNIAINNATSIFYHLAWLGTTGEARNDMSLQLKNIEYALDAIEVASAIGCTRFIGAGSQAEYGRVEGKLTATTPTNPENGYGIAKLTAGKMTRIRAEQLGIEHVWTRILSIYGPNDGPQSMVMSTIAKLKKGERPSLTKGEQLWDYLNSEDAARALRLLGTVDLNSTTTKNKSVVDGKIYPIGSGHAMPLREYIETIRDLVNPDAELGLGDIPYAKNQVMHLEADISELTRDTGFVPSVDFKDGISAILGRSFFG